MGGFWIPAYAGMSVRLLDTETLKHDIRVMKNVTITLPEDLARRARVEAAKQDKSLSRFVADLLAERCKGKTDKLAVLESFLNGPGFPGASKAWPGREALYAEREDELLRRYESSRLRDGPDGAGKTNKRFGFAEADRQRPYAGAQPAKSKRMLPRSRGKTPSRNDR
jgi:hypothetical protein